MFTGLRLIAFRSSTDTFITDGSGNVIAGNQQCISAAGNQAAVNQLASYGCYVSGATTLTPPINGTFGDAGRNIFRGPDLRTGTSQSARTRNWANT